MKKIFTLIAIAMMAVGAQAQEKLVFSETETYTDNQELGTENVKLILGNDLNPGTWIISKSAMDAEKNAYLSDFFQTITTDDGEKNGVVAVNGGNNPKDKTDKGAGSGFNAAEGKSLGNLPQNGTYFILKPAVAGTFKVGIVLNKDKPFYLVDATNAAADETNTYLQVALPDANLHTYSMKNGAGEEVELVNASDEKGGMSVAEKLNGTLEFVAEAGHIYYIFCTGSKLGSYGYVFTPGTETGINSINAESTAEAPAYNLAGQKVGKNFKGIMIQNGKKVVIK